MIKVKVKYKNNKFFEISISGHSGYSEKGSDIVCAAVSSIITTSVNGILSIKETINVTDDGNILKIKILDLDNITEKLLDNMIKLFKGIETQYKNNLKVIKEGE